MDIIKWGLIIFLLMGITGCAVTTTIIDPCGNTWKIISKKDALVKLEKEETKLEIKTGIKIEVDNRGKLGLFENLMGIIFMKTDIDIKNKEGSR